MSGVQYGWHRKYVVDEERSRGEEPEYRSHRALYAMPEGLLIRSMLKRNST